MNSIYFWGFATFGHPNDFRQSLFYRSNKEIANNFKIYDLTNAIKVFPNSKLYSIRKEMIGSYKGVSYTIYTYAQEMTSKRDGTFIGSSILFINEITEENQTVVKLNEFHEILIQKNTKNNILTVNHSDQFEHSKNYLDEFEKNNYTLKQITDIENFSYTKNNLVLNINTDPENLASFLKKSLILLNRYDTLFFTSSKEIIEYCKSKNIYSVEDENNFEKIIKNLESERKQNLYNSANNFNKSQLEKLFENNASIYNELQKLEEKYLNIIRKNNYEFFIQNYQKQYLNEINNLKSKIQEINQLTFNPIKESSNNHIDDKKKNQNNSNIQENNPNNQENSEKNDKNDKNSNKSLHFLKDKDLKDFNNSEEVKGRIKGQTASQIVELIYNKFPEKIEKYYIQNKEEYINLLKENNKGFIQSEVYALEGLTQVPIDNPDTR